MTDDAGASGLVGSATGTRLVHAGSSPSRQHGYVNPPVYRGSTIIYDDLSALQASQADPLRRQLPAYGRFGTPTSRAFEEAMAELEGGQGAIATCSGLSAISTAILAFVRSGDHILVSDSVYQPTRRFCDSLSAFGIRTEFYDPAVESGIAGLLRPETRLVYLESPGSETFEVQDLPAITGACRDRGVITIADNTWATPLFCRPLGLGADVVVHSASKYLTGHADSLLGVIICRDEVYPAVRECSIRLGQCAGADDAYAGLRGLRTLGVRVRAHQNQALELAAWLAARPEIETVHYPALPQDPGHALWRRDFSGAAGLFTIVLNSRYDEASMTAMLDRLTIFGLGHGWGGYESLVVPVQPSASRRYGRTGCGPMLRFHIGLEDVDDLRADLSAGLSALAPGRR